jgi:hypothetical protein
VQKNSEGRTFEDDRPLSVQGIETLLLPVADGIAVAIEELRRLIHRVEAINFDPPGVWEALPHAPLKFCPMWISVARRYGIAPNRPDLPAHRWGFVPPSEKRGRRQ